MTAILAGGKFNGITIRIAGKRFPKCIHVNKTLKVTRCPKGAIGPKDEMKNFYRNITKESWRNLGLIEVYGVNGISRLECDKLLPIEYQ